MDNPLKLDIMVEMLVKIDTELDHTLKKHWLEGEALTLENLNLPHRYLITHRQLMSNTGKLIEMVEYTLRMVSF